MTTTVLWRHLRCLAMLAALGLAGAPTQAAAHAGLLRSAPAAGTVTPSDTPPRHVSLWFSEPVEVAFNGVSVLDPDSRRVDRLNAHVATEDPRRVEVELDASGGGHLADGAYLVRWRATSVDNHVVGGTFWFAIGYATALPSAALIPSGEPTPAPLEVVARWLALVSLFVLAGAALFPLFVSTPARRRLSAGASSVFDNRRARTRLLLVAAGLFVVAHVLWAGAQAEAIGEVALPRALDGTVLRAVFLESRFAVLLWARVWLGLALAAILLARARRPAGESRAWLLVGTALTLLVCLSLSLGGHAASARWSAPLALAVDAVHLAAASMWLGGLAQVSLLLPAVVRADPGPRSELLRALVPRVSGVALLCVLALVATGVFSAWEQAGFLDLVVVTAYGQALIAKLGLLLPLLLIAAVNLLILRPRLARATPRVPAMTWFGRFVVAEVALGSAVLVPTALLTSLTPPAQQGVPASAELARQAGELRIALSVDPLWIGVSHFGLVVTDARGQAAADVTDAIFTFTMEGMNMGRTTVRATPRGPGVFEADGFYLGMPGASLVGVALSRTAGPEQSAIFRVDVPDISQEKFAGLLPVLRHGNTRASAASATLEQRGQQLYAAQCVACHGETGTGNGPAAASLLPPPADLTLHARWHSDAQLFWFISNGVAGTAMPAFVEQLSTDDRQAIVGYLHALAAAPTASPPRAAPAVASPQPTATATSVDTAAELTGRLVFGPDSDRDFWLWQFPADAPQRLTRFSRLDFASHPVWSPDGLRLAFSFYSVPRVGAVPAGTDLYVVDADGTNMHILADHDGQGAALLYPAWAADGAALYATHQARAASGGTATRVVRVDARSGQVQTVLPDAGFPSPSRDGRRLAYVSMPNPDGSGQSLWVSADGQDRAQLVPVGAFVRFASVRFAPNGQRILFAAVGQGGVNGSSAAAVRDPLGLLRALIGGTVARADGEEWDFWTVTVDGRDLRRLTSIAEDLPVASWSPTGAQIVFLGGGSARTAETGLVIMSADGTLVRRLTTRPGHRGADWSPVP